MNIVSYNERLVVKNSFCPLDLFRYQIKFPQIHDNAPFSRAKMERHNLRISLPLLSEDVEKALFRKVGINDINGLYAIKSGKLNFCDTFPPGEGL